MLHLTLDMVGFITFFRGENGICSTRGLNDEPFFASQSIHSEWISIHKDHSSISSGEPLSACKYKDSTSPPRREIKLMWHTGILNEEGYDWGKRKIVVHPIHYIVRNT